MARTLTGTLLVLLAATLIVSATREFGAHRLLRQARTELGWGRLETSADFAERAVALEPGSAEARRSLGEVELALGRWRNDLARTEAGLRQYGIAVGLNPLDETNWGAYAEVLLAHERYEAAERAATRGLERDPLNAYLQALRGQAVLALGRPAEAVEIFERAQATRPNGAVRRLLEQARDAVTAGETP